MQEHASVPLLDLVPSPIRRRKLSPKLQKKVKDIYDVIGRYLGATLEEFETDFRRDEQPWLEIAIWSDIAAAWRDYHAEFLKGEMLPLEDEQRLISALSAISIGENQDDDFGLPKEVVRGLIACFTSQRKRP